MATLTDLYDYLEKKNSKEHIDQDFPLSSFHPNEQFTARLEILTWWNIETLVEDKNVEMDQKTVTTYLDKRIKATNNSLLKYRYCYFSYLLSNDNRYRGFFVIYTAKRMQIYRFLVFLPTPFVYYEAAATLFRTIESGDCLSLMRINDSDYIANKENMQLIKQWTYSWTLKI